MLFTCKFQLNNGAIRKTDEIIFVEFFNDSFEVFQDKSVKIASILFNRKPALIYSNCPCFVSSKGNLEKGDSINEETIIGYFSANGEDIPYNKPFAKIVFEENIELRNQTKVKISIYSKIGLFFLVIGALLFIMAVSLFTYQGETRIPKYIRQIGEFSMILWLPFSLIGTFIIGFRIINNEVKKEASIE